MHSVSKFKVGDVVAFNISTGNFNFNRIICSYGYGLYDVEILNRTGLLIGRVKKGEYWLSQLSLEQALLATKLGLI